jgi:protein TonB
VKWNPLQLSFGFSLLFHAAMWGVIAWTGMLFLPPEPLYDNSPTAIAFVAAPAPDKITPTEKRPVAFAAHPQVILPRPIVEEVKKSEVAVPAEHVSPTQILLKSELPPSPTPQPAPAITIHDEDSSTNSGIDLKAQGTWAAKKAEPNCQKNSEPSYPLAARRRGEQGLVVLAATVSKEGHVAKVTLEHSSGFSLLDAAALRAVRDWEFEPARLGPLAMESEVEVPIRFRLKE